ncbi:MAG: hypothetical protein ACOH2V_11955 [Candidatus Saccharimonadaceae bacterium]
MRKITLVLFLIVSFVSFSQEPFRYDTIRVSKDDSRNINQYQTNEGIATQVPPNSHLNELSTASGFDAKKLRYGINFGLNFSSNYSLFRFAPQVGYQFNKYVMTGVGVSYYYSKNRLYHQQERVFHYNNSLGANAFAYLYPMRFLAVSAQPELNYIWSRLEGDVNGEYNKENVLVPSFVIGAGLRIGSAHAMLYYDLVQDVNSPYSSGIFYGVSVYF